MTEDKLLEALIAVGDEVKRAQGLFPMGDVPKRVIPHYYLGVIKEEFAEFEKEVFAFNPNKNRDTRPAMREELVQLAAMALRAYAEI